MSSQADDSLPPKEEKKDTLVPEEPAPRQSEIYGHLTEEEFNALTKEQQDALVELNSPNPPWRYYRQEQIILGNITEDEPRLDLETAKQIIADFEDGKYTEKMVVGVFLKLFPYYDYAGGSGISRVQYWLDETGTSVITVWNATAVTYDEYDAEGNTVLSEKLYGFSAEAEE